MSGRTSKKADHRTRVGAERRERMRAHLLECALTVFAEHGLDASIETLVESAEVSRGTFYNYFQTTREVVQALGDVLAGELIELVESTTAPYEDPLERLAVGVRIFLHTTRAHPTFAAFLFRTAFEASTALVVLRAHLPRHLEEGILTGRFQIARAELGLFVVGGIVLSSAFARSMELLGPDDPEHLARSIFLALGAEPSEVERVLRVPLPRVAWPEGSLLARTCSSDAVAAL